MKVLTHDLTLLVVVVLNSILLFNMLYSNNVLLVDELASVPIYTRTLAHAGWTLLACETNSIMEGNIP